MECKNMEMKDQFNTTAGFFQKVKLCKHSGQPCQGGEEICSMFEAKEEKHEEKPKTEEKPAPDNQDPKAEAAEERATEEQ